MAINQIHIDDRDDFGVDMITVQLRNPEGDAYACNHAGAEPGTVDLPDGPDNFVPMRALVCDKCEAFSVDNGEVWNE